MVFSALAHGHRPFAGFNNIEEDLHGTKKGIRFPTGASGPV
jgi:hypothetical protein